MSSIVSRRPPASASVSQANDLRWISMRLGTSSTCSRRAKLRRVRRASTAATETTPRDRRYRAGRAHEVRPAKIAQQTDAPWVGDRLSRTPPGQSAYVARSPAVDGCGYRPIAGQCSGDSRSPPPPAQRGGVPVPLPPLRGERGQPAMPGRHGGGSRGVLEVGGEVVAGGGASVVVG